MPTVGSTSKAATQKTAPPTPPVLKRGMKGAAVLTLQRKLERVGYLSPAALTSGPGIFGPATEAAVKSFQGKAKLPKTGVYGGATRAALDKAYAAAPKPKVLRGIFYNDRFGKQVSLTFDDGPHPVNTPRVLDILKKAGVKATFYVTGINAQRYPALVRRIVREGHTLANHSWDHSDLARLSPAQIRSQLSRTDAAVERALGRRYKMSQMRPPYGSVDADVNAVVAQTGRTSILWQVDSNDWRYRNDDARILRNVFQGGSSIYARGGVILFHDVHPQTVRVIDDVIARLQRDKFQFRSVGQLLQRKYGTAAIA